MASTFRIGLPAVKIGQNVFGEEIDYVDMGIDRSSTMLKTGFVTQNIIPTRSRYGKVLTCAVPLLVATAVRRKIAVFLSFQ
jgi:hypothetical protein